MHKRRKVHHGNSKVEAVEVITASIALPQNAPPIRFRDITTSTKTALAKAFQRPSADWPDNPAATQITNASTYLAVLFRHPLRTLVLALKSGLAATSQYAWWSQSDATIDGTFSLFAGSAGESLEVIFARYNNVGVPYHGTFLYPGISGVKRFLWNDYGTIYIKNTIAIPSTDAFTFTIWRYDSGQVLQAAEISFPASTTINTVKSFAVLINDYYAISYTSTTTASSPAVATFTVTGESTGGGGTQYEAFAHMAFPSLDVNQSRVTGARMIGNALLLHNSSSAQYANGNWAGLQLGKGDKWTNYIGTVASAVDPYPLITATKGVVVGDLRLGMYGYHKPVQQKSFDLVIPFNLGLAQGIVGCNGFPLDEEAATMLVLNSPSGDGTLSHAFQLSWDCSLEFTTEDMWTMVKPAAASPEEWERAMMVLSSMDQFYDNPVHWARIIKTIGKYATIGAPIASLFGPYGRIVGGVLSSIGSLADAATAVIGEGEGGTGRNSLV